MMDAPPPPPDQELPPPPPEMEQEVKGYPDIEVRKPGPFAALRRALTIFEKDLRTIAKHGLVGSVISVVVLAVLLFVSSVFMTIVLDIDFGDGGDGGEDGGDGDGIDLPGGTESVPPVADPGPDRTVGVGELVTLDASGSTDNAQIVYYMWSFSDSGRDVERYGAVASYRFMAAGDYEIQLTVVDSSWNMDDASLMITVESAGSDSIQPIAQAGEGMFLTAGQTVELNGSGSSDDVGVVNWTWTFEDTVQRTMFGPRPSYTFQNAGNFMVTLVVRDEAGNTGWGGVEVNVQPSGEDWQSPEARFDTDTLVTIGETVDLDASESHDEMGGIDQFTWYIKHNGTKWVQTGQMTSFEAQEWGPYEIILEVRDFSGNVGTTDMMVFALPIGFDTDMISWTATPFGQELSFNLLTYAYGAALLTSVIFVGGLFAKGFSHEIQRGTAKSLFFAPLSVTTVIFSKLLYPIVIGPLFVFPVMLIAMIPFGQSATDILVITAVSYLLTVLVLISAAYGSCLIYLATKRMSLKPPGLAKAFMYLSLLGTLTVFEWSSFFMDMNLSSDRYGDMYAEYGSSVAMFSPFHQGGVLLSDLVLGTGASMDLWVFVIPVALIAAGVAASLRLYPDLFTKE